MKHAIDAYRIDFTIEDSLATGHVLDLYLGVTTEVEFGEYTTCHFKRGVE